MSHSDPVIALLAGGFFMLAGAALALDPEGLPRTGEPVLRWIESVAGERVANGLLRLIGIVAVIVSALFLFHTVVGLLR